jgi:hypothetical protein
LKNRVEYRSEELPAGFATTATTAGATTSTAGSPAAATSATGTPTTGAATTTEASATTAATTEAAVGFGTGFVHVQRTSVQGVAIEGGNGLVRLAFIFHFDECETAGTSGLTICHDSGAVHLAVAFEEAAHALLGCVEIQVAYEYVLHSSSLLSI